MFHPQFTGEEFEAFAPGLMAAMWPIHRLRPHQISYPLQGFPLSLSFRMFVCKKVFILSVPDFASSSGPAIPILCWVRSAWNSDRHTVGAQQIFMNKGWKEAFILQA